MRLSHSSSTDPGRIDARAGWIAGRTFAHRGLHGPGVPENSPAAFSAAIARGHGIECDVQLSADGVAIVFHDWELDRLTQASGPVRARSVRELGRIGLCEGVDTIPTLAQVLDLVAGRAPLMIEVKSRRDIAIGPVCEAVQCALAAYDGVYGVMSFDPRVPNWFFHHSPDTTRGLVVTEEDRKGRWDDLRRRLALWHAHADFLAYDVRDLPSRFAAAQRARGLPLATWTVRSPEHRALAARHADAPIAEGHGIA